MDYIKGKDVVLGVKRTKLGGQPKQLCVQIFKGQQNSASVKKLEQNYVPVRR